MPLGPQDITGEPIQAVLPQTFTSHVSAKGITDELVQQVADELRTRYGLDDEDVRALGSRLADAASERRTENLAFARRFTDEHRKTFDRLAE